MKMNAMKRKNGVPRSTKAAVNSDAISKPCLTLDYCPYGVLIERFPLTKAGDHRECDRFGHLCPAFLVAERRCDGKAESATVGIRLDREAV